MRTTSPEEAAHIQSTVNNPVRVQRLDRRAAFRWDANRIQLGRLGIIVSQYRASLQAGSEGPAQQFSVAVPIHGGGQARQGRKVTALAPGHSAALCSASVPAEFSLGTGYQGRTVTMPARVVESTLDALTGVSRAESVRFELSVDISGAGGAAMLRLLEFIIAEADRGAGAATRSPIVESRLAEAFVSTLLVEMPHNHSHLFTAKPKAVEPRCVRRAEEYLEANAHEAITLADLAAVTGVGIRTLTAAFRAHRGQSPMAFLRARRFELAHARLAAAPATTVAAVALSCGFEHLGRFSVGYRARFGESPLETLRRSRRR